MRVVGNSNPKDKSVYLALISAPHFTPPWQFSFDFQLK